MAIPAVAVRSEEQATPAVGYHSGETLTASSLTPPVRIVGSAAAGDGGTLRLKLVGANNRMLTLSLTQDAFEVLVPGHTLFLDEPMSLPGEPGEPDDESSAHLRERLPRSQEEVAAVLSVLANACEDTESPSVATVKSIIKSLQAKQEIAVWDGVSDAKPEWFSEYERERAEGEARAAENDRQEAIARRLFSQDQLKLLEPPRSGLFEEREVAVKANQLRASFEADDVRMILAILQALGRRDHGDWFITDQTGEILVHALALVPDQITHAVDEVVTQPAADNALLRRGAFRVLFDPDLAYSKRLDARDWPELAEPLFESEYPPLNSTQQAYVVWTLSAERGPIATRILRGIAEGTLQSHEFDDLESNVISAPAHACLALACRNDRSVEPSIRKRLQTKQRPIDRSALEVALANLGEHDKLKASCFGFESPTLERAALHAIESFRGNHGMELLMSPMVLGGTSTVQEEGVALACRLTGQRWQPSDETIRSGDYGRDAAEWWKTHGDELDDK